MSGVCAGPNKRSIDCPRVEKGSAVVLQEKTKAAVLMINAGARDEHPKMRKTGGGQQRMQRMRKDKTQHNTAITPKTCRNSSAHKDFLWSG